MARLVREVFLGLLSCFSCPSLLFIAVTLKSFTQTNPKFVLYTGRGGRPAVARRGDEDAAVTSWAHLRGRGLTGRRT